MLIIGDHDVRADTGAPPTAAAAAILWAAFLQQWRKQKASEAALGSRLTGSLAGGESSRNKKNSEWPPGGDARRVAELAAMCNYYMNKNMDELKFS